MSSSDNSSNTPIRTEQAFAQTHHAAGSVGSGKISQEGTSGNMTRSAESNPAAGKPSEEVMKETEKTINQVAELYEQRMEEEYAKREGGA